MISSMLNTEDDKDIGSYYDELHVFDARSPEGRSNAEFKGRKFAFVGLERIDGVMIFDVSDPHNPRYVSFTNHQEFLIEDTENEDATDLETEALLLWE